MLVSEDIINERGRVGETLQHRVEEARVAHVLETGPDTSYVGPLPLKLDPLRSEQDHLGHRQSVDMFLGFAYEKGENSRITDGS